MSQQSPLGPLTLVSPPQMTNPAIQNDFSYYRRTISRNRINNLQVRGLCCPPRGSQGWEWLGGVSATPVTPITPPPAGCRERGEQRDGQQDVPLLRRGHPHAENPQQCHHQVRVRGEGGWGATLRVGKTPSSHHTWGWGWKQQLGCVWFQNKTLPIEDTTDCLSTMACVCRVMLETP